ncbi:MAG: DEAD/DEAH box helicase [Defluviitaleaceae bacterium]|nr:DEAD/DEAH box helicase [Defluviitaleaceae bacterium]
MNFIDIFDNWDNFKTKPSLSGITAPTDVQAAAMPLVLGGRDVMIQSPTGTGKTLTYLLPIFANIKPDVKAAQAVIIAPTYELASQIAQVARGLFERSEDIALLIGGAAKQRQLAAIKAKPRIIVGTLGRIGEFVTDKKISMHHVRTLVFDEADRLFVPENTLDISLLIKSTLRDRQIVLVSATLPKKTQDAAAPLMKEPETIALGGKIPQNIKHYYIICDGRKKDERLRALLINEKIKKALVFVNMPYAIEKTTDRLNHHGIASKALHVTHDKTARKAAMQSLRSGKTVAVVSSDAGSRGLDIEGLTHVINLDMPAREKDYLHRAGRCGRAGASGIVISIITQGEAETLKKMAAKLKIDITAIK